jgi:hypothetical protein
MSKGQTKEATIRLRLKTLEIDKDYAMLLRDLVMSIPSLTNECPKCMDGYFCLPTCIRKYELYRTLDGKYPTRRGKGDTMTKWTTQQAGREVDKFVRLIPTINKLQKKIDEE